MKKLLSFLTALTLLLSYSSFAMAESITMNGVVMSDETHTLTSSIGGTILETYVNVGQHVNAGDVIATLDTTKVYAQQDGTAYIFGEIGDSADAVNNRYGAFVYIEPSYGYTIEASTSNSYDREENRMVHPGEHVYLRGYNDHSYKGEGYVTTVSGTSFTVEVHSGNFKSGEQMNIFREADYANDSRIGRGKISRTDPIAYTGEGSLLKYHVTNGQTVEKGDLLFETVDGTFDADTTICREIVADVSGIVTEMSVAPGSTLSADGTVMTIYPDSAMRIEAAVYESDLTDIQIGSAVTIEFTYVNNGEKVVSGTVERISLIANDETSEETEEASYAVYILLDDTSGVHYGMNAVVSTIENAAVQNVPAATQPPADEQNADTETP